MGGASTYDNFDSSSIVSRNTNDTVSIGKFTLRKREVVLGAIAVAALVGVLILAIVLAVRASDSDSSSSNKVTISDNGQTSKHMGGSVSYCQTPSCLKSAVYQKPLLNEAVDPCTDFYDFACGHYAEHHAQSPLMESVTPQDEITHLNIQRLVFMLSHPITSDENSYEKKLKDFMTSCDNHFDKMTLKGTPLINNVIKPMGGWWVFDQNVLDTFDFQESLEKVHIDYWSQALFRVSIEYNDKDWNSYLLAMDAGGLGLDNLSWYAYSAVAELVQKEYKRLMISLATMLCLDNGVTINNTNIHQFAEDALEVEHTVAFMTLISPKFEDPHHPSNLMSLSDLNGHMNGSFDFIAYMKKLFDENPGKFEADTKVSVTRLYYFENLGHILQRYLTVDENGNRKLHNYMMWRLIQTYSKDLSWHYIHATRKLDYALTGVKDDSSGYVYCFNQARQSLGDAMNALFIHHFVKNSEKDEAEQILDHVRSVMLEKIKQFPWMSESNRNDAIKKIKMSIYKIGFPKQFIDNHYLNNEYSYISISATDYFQNVLNLKKLHRHKFNELIAKSVTKTQWAYHVFDPIVEYHNPWVELIATSAAIQNPLFSAKGPAYYNYGGVGSILATNLLHAIDEYGSNYKDDGSSFENWWTTVTQKHYATIKQCAFDSQEDQVFPTVEIGNVVYKLNATKLAHVWSPQLLAESTGVRLAYLAYLQSGKKTETLPPGFSNYNSDQMFFISYAQSHCQNSPPLVKFVNLYRSARYPGKNRVNLAVKQVPEFQRVFDCKAAPTNPCLLFDNTN